MARPQTISDEAIRVEARACLLEHGPAVSVATIAARLGVSAPALLQRVGSKVALLRLALVPELPADWARSLAEGPALDQPLRPQLTALLQQLEARFAQVVPSLIVARASRLDLSELSAQALDGAAQVRRATAAWLHRAGAASPEALAELLVGAVESRCFLAYMGGAPPATGLDELARAVLP